ncbi:MAG: AMP-binding protein [Gammaproteobacteria bacterium]|jgi:acyl-coenzyme A synthetase/AMP-(fatty) acid ligase|nr:AMP-binding protein [Gammaproteobacteria bacterium]HJP36047.1 AMP-binding protein [Gammaproteobacteria bacterium]
MPNMRNYEQERAAYTWEAPDKFNFARDVIDEWAARDPQNLALWWIDDHGTEIKRTFAELSERSRRLCNVLSRAGVGRGDTVIAMLGRNVEWWEILTACLRMGAVCSPGTTQLSPKDIEYRIDAATAVCFITDEANAPKLEAVSAAAAKLKGRIVVGGERDGWIGYDQAMADVSDQFETADTGGADDALCYFTSGTTGYPKMTIQPHSYGLAHQITGRYWLDLTPEDLHWNISDTGWAKAAWSSFFGPWNCGATLFVHHTDAFDPRKSLALLGEYPITTLCGAPTIYRMFVLQDLSQYEFPSLRHCVGAGEPLNPEVIETWRKATGMTIRDGYGQTETVLLCGSFPCIEPRFGSMGKPSPGIDLAVVDDDGRVLGPDEEGDIAVRVKPHWPPGLFTEYRGEPERTDACFHGDWYLTGDRAKTDEDGYFWFMSRADDVILSAGYRIGPFEVESALIEHPAVAESAVVASPDETRGAVVKAFVVLAPGHDASDALMQEIQDHVKRVTAPYKYPRKIEFLDALPKTVSGKIRRVELRGREYGEDA